MVRAMLRRATSFTTGRFGATFKLHHLLAWAIALVTIGGFLHLYVHGFLNAAGSNSSSWHCGGAATTIASLSRNVASLQTKVGKAMEEIQTRLAEGAAETLDEALHQLRFEGKKNSNLLVDVAFSLDLVHSYLEQTLTSCTEHLSYIPRASSDVPACIAKAADGPGESVAVLEDEKEEGEWGEEEGKVKDPFVNSFEIEEIRKYIKAKSNRLGRKNFMGANATYASIGHACVSLKYELEQYMDYEVGEYCADDWMLGQKLMVLGCDPLPRRRCFVRGPKTYQKPLPLYDSLWTIPDDRNVRWDSYICKGFKCLGSADRKGFFKCSECFNLEGHEKPKWVQLTNTSTEVDFLLEEVLSFKPGEIRIGLDFSVGVGTFAARMREHNITVASATLNLGAPFNEIIALRGLLPLYLTVNQRLPFFDNTLDIVHSTLFLDGWIDHQLLDFVLLDWDRVIRPGGLLWIDRFFSKEEDMDDYLYYFEQLKYKRLKWVVTPKSDKGEDEIWFSAVLEKPPRPF